MLYANGELNALDGRLKEDPRFSGEVDSRILVNHPLTRIDQLLTDYQSTVNHSGLDSRLIEEAIELIFEHYGRKRRKNGRLAVAHPIRVSKYIVEQFGCTDPVLVVAGLLHDVPEDVPLYHDHPELIGDQFGSDIGRVVLGMTNQKLTDDENRQYSARVSAELGFDPVTVVAVIKHFGYYFGIRQKIQDPQVLVVKSADIRGNVSSIHRLDEETRARIASKYAPTLHLFLEGFRRLAGLSGELGINVNAGRDLTTTFRAGNPQVQAYAQEWQHYEAQQRVFDLLLEDK